MKETELYFLYRCEKGLKERGLDSKPEYVERLNYETSVIIDMGFASYFLVVADIAAWAKSQGMVPSAGRGSCAGSLVAYSLQITHVDPIKYGLIFERFLNPTRRSMPDIDQDFEEDRRSEVIEYIKQKYGEKQFAHIGTYGSMKAKGAIRDVTRTLGFPYEMGDKLAKLILDPIEGKAQPLSVCYEKVPELKSYRYGEDSDYKTILIWAEKFEERLRSFGMHASGAIISDAPLAKSIPLSLGKNSQATAQFSMEIVEDLGFVKFDILGLRALTTIRRCLELIKQNHNKTIDILNVPIDDPTVYQMLQSGDTKGVFQLEGSSGIQDLVVKVQPKNIEDISLLIAIYRPGPLARPGLERFLKVRSGEESPYYLIPELEPVLKRTDGFLIYQEEAMEICKQIAGYTMAEADIMRKIIGKKKPAEMAQQKEKFIQGATAKGIELSAINQIWEDIEAFAGYGFNVGHSMSYSYVSYWMAYLKAHYPTEFICACLISDSDEEDKVIQYISYCKEKGIPILGPSVNESQVDFSISNGKIRFGLSAIKNLGKPVQEIIEERERAGRFKDLLDFCSRVDITKINKLRLESLVFSGAFDDTNKGNRASLIAAIEKVLEHKEELKRYTTKQSTYEKRIEAFNKRKQEIEEFDKDSSGKKRPAMLKKPEAPEIPSDPNIPNIEEYPIEELLRREKELTRFYITGHPLDHIKERSRYNISRIKEEGKHKNKFSLVAIPSTIKEITTKASKKQMAYLELEDKTGTVTATVMPKVFAACKKYIDIESPARYDVEVDITENDLEKIIKFNVLNVQELPSVAARKTVPLKITVPLAKAKEAVTILNEARGESFPVILSVENGNHKWSFDPIGCKGDRFELAKKVNS